MGEVSNIHIFIMGDLHIRATSPRYRTDEYYNTLMGKLEWGFDLAKKENCDAILQPGDFFDGPDQSNKVEIAIINLIEKYNIPIYTVLGQHDLRYRQPTNVALTKFDVLGKVCIVDENGIDLGDNVHVYGSSWEKETPTPKDSDAINILVMHRMVIKDKSLWPGQENFTMSSSLLKKHPYNLIVTGDNHSPLSFIDKQNNSMLINCGSLMRTTTLQRKHRPQVYVYNTETRKATRYLIPTKPIEDVMDLETADEVKEKNEALDAFMDGLSSDYDIELKFEDNLKNLMIGNETDNRIKKLANSFLEKYYEGGK